MIFSQPNFGFKIDISDEILSEMMNSMQRQSPNETGGILLGYYAKDKKTAYVTQHLTPENSKGSPILFERTDNNLKEYLTELYDSSNPPIHYLGEWHSHPGGPPHPSSTDLKAMNYIASHEDVKINNPILLIIGNSSTEMKFNFFVLINGKLSKYE